MTPVLVGLVLAIPLAAFTARRSTGQALRRVGLLRIPEEVQPPDVLASANRLLREVPPEHARAHGILRLLEDPLLMEAHRRMLPPRPPVRPDAIDTALAVARARLDLAQSPAEALAAMTQSERSACLSDPVSLDKLEALAARETAPASYPIHAPA
jgi:membrane glycosyltransferase